MKDEWLSDKVADREPIGVSTYIASHLPNRKVLYGGDNLISTNIDHIDKAIYDALFDGVIVDDDGSFLGGALYDADKISLLLDHPDFVLVDARDGLLMFERGASDRELVNSVSVAEQKQEVEDYHTVYDDNVLLVDISVTHLKDRKYRLEFTWQAKENLPDMPPMFPVSRLKDVDDTRFVHLPTMFVHPTDRWQKGDIVTEAFDIVIPEDVAAGTYVLLTGWYDSANPYAFKTDERSRIGNEIIVSEINLGN
jgi:hypothetical protein